MLTSKGIYNLTKTSLIDIFLLNKLKINFQKEIKRKIASNKIAALTISKVGSEFVIHVPDEYDYRYASVEK